MTFRTYQAQYCDGTFGALCGDSGGLSRERMARIAADRLSQIDVERIRFRSDDGTILRIDRSHAFVVGMRGAKSTRHGEERVVHLPVGYIAT